MNQRTRSSSRRAKGGSRVADAQALRVAHGITAPSAGIETLPERAIDTLPAVTIHTSELASWTRKSREECIAEAAYLRAEARGFGPGHELEDWLAAEKALDAMFAAE